MDITEQAEQIVKSLYNAIANDNATLIAELTADLTEINDRLIADGFTPIAIPTA